MGKLQNMLEEIKEEYREEQEDMRVWDEIDRLRDAVSAQSKMLKIIVLYLDKKEEDIEEDICVKELKRRVEQGPVGEAI